MSSPCRPACLGALLALAAGCTKPVATPMHDDQAPPTNRIAVPAIVRQNLGIEFAAVARRRVATTLRVPGHFELLPRGRTEYRAPLAGRVQVHAEPLQAIAAGDRLCSLDAPAWRTMQRELGELTTRGQVAAARIAAMTPLQAAHRAHEDGLRQAVAVTAARRDSLDATQRDIGGQAPELAAISVQLAQLRAQLAEAEEKHAELEATLAELAAELRASHDRFELLLAGAAAVVARRASELATVAPGNEPQQPRWRTMADIDLIATAAGIADHLPIATGTWVEAGDLIATVTDLTQLRFAARALQSDLLRLRPGLPARAVRPQGDTADVDALAGTLLLGTEADPAQRTIDLFLQPADAVAIPAWARPGIAGFLEIETDGSAEPELAIPLAAVLQDGLQHVLVRRDPANADLVIRVEADLGRDDGRWVAVRSGLRDGDAVVLAGAYELLLASSGTIQKGGHFHADGSFHQAEHK